MLCVLIYVRTGCGLRTIVSILGIFDDVLGESFGKAPCYNTVRNWVLKLGLSVYEQDTQLPSKYGVVIDESIMINKEKLLLVLGFNADKTGAPLSHGDVEVLDMKVAYSFLPSYRELIGELAVSVGAIRHVEKICKNEGFSRRTSAVCQSHVIMHVVGNANNRRASLGLEMVDYFRRQEELLEKADDIHHISSDIIESVFVIYKAKKSPNKLYGITPLVLMLPLYPKVAEYSDAESQDFKVRLANVKLKEVDLWARENLSPNRVSIRSRTLKKVS